MNGSRQRRGCRACGITLGVLAVLFVLTFLLAWPRFQDAVVQTKQKRVIADLLLWASAVEAYASDTGSLPAASGPVDEVLFPLLSPKYVVQPFRDDFWGEPIEYAVSPDGKHYQIVSRGWKGDAEFPRGFANLEAETTSCWESDMVLQDGELLRRPAGPQRSCSLGPLAGFFTLPQAPPRARDELSRRD